MPENISVVGGLLTGFIALIMSSIVIFSGGIAAAGTYLIASALAFGLIAIAVVGKREH